MKITISYCRICGHKGRAQRMAREIKDALALDADLRTGPTGRFDVFIDDEMIASRQRVGVVDHVLGTGAFPEGAAVVDEIRKRLQAGS